MVWQDNIDLGEGILPIHLLNVVCAVHLRQEHGFKRWQISRFKETYPWLIREDGAFSFAALHYLVHVLVHVEEAAVPLDEMRHRRLRATDQAAWSHRPLESLVARPRPGSRHPGAG
jgi:hypothetical protein